MNILEVNVRKSKVMIFKKNESISCEGKLNSQEVGNMIIKCLHTTV